MVEINKFKPIFHHGKTPMIKQGIAKPPRAA